MSNMTFGAILFGLGFLVVFKSTDFLPAMGMWLMIWGYDTFKSDKVTAVNKVYIAVGAGLAASFHLIWGMI